MGKQLRLKKNQNNKTSGIHSSEFMKIVGDTKVWALEFVTWKESMTHSRFRKALCIEGFNLNFLIQHSWVGFMSEPQI